MNTRSRAMTLRDLRIDEIETVSGGKKEILHVAAGRCESHQKGGKKISVCTAAHRP